MSTTTDSTDTTDDSPLEFDSPDFLNELAEEVEEAVDMAENPHSGRIASEMAPEQRHLINDTYHAEYIGKIQTLANHDCLSTDNLEIHRQAALSFDPDTKTMQAVLISSLETFIARHAEAYIAGKC